MIDRFSRWIEAVPLETQTAEDVARAFHQQWVCRFGVAKTVTTDRGRQFESQLYQHLNKFYGTKKTRTTAYNPKANGIVERCHRTLKAALRALGDPEWSETLPTVLLGIRTALREDSECSPAELVYGKQITIPGEFFESKTSAKISENEFVEKLRQHMKDIKPVTATHHTNNKVFIHKDLENSTHVFLRHDATKPPLDPPYDGPFKVLERNGKFFKIKLKNREDTVSIDRLKPAYFLNNDTEETELPMKLRSGRRVSFKIDILEKEGESCGNHNQLENENRPVNQEEKKK
jgi:cleavage and polyadenylation specificity factor subunit 1